MKKLVTLILFLATHTMYAQFTTINPDTVCYQTAGSIYQVSNAPGYTYNWTILAPLSLI